MQQMRDVLRANLARSLRDLSAVDRLAAAWPVACGSALAAHGSVLQLDEEHVVHIQVDGDGWMSEFLQMRAMLKAELARVAGVQLSEIHFINARKKVYEHGRS